MPSDRVAFREARLKSERLRIRIFLGIAIAAFLLRMFRAALLGGRNVVMASQLKREPTRTSDGRKKQAFRKTEPNLAATLHDSAIALPLAQQATRRKSCDVGGASQLLVCGVELESA